jgi:hypothetical protein
MGSFISSIADFGGDILGGIGDFAGDVIETAVDYAPEIAAIVAAYYTMNPALAGEALAGDAIYTDYALGSAGAGAGAGAGFMPGAIPGGGYTGGMISTGIESLDSALNLAKQGYNLYTLYDKLGNANASNPIQPLTVQQTSQGTAVNPQQFSQGLQYITYANSPELNQINSIINQPQYKANEALSTMGVSDISEAIKKYGPSIISVIGGKLAYDDQKRINDIITGAYNKYNVGTELKKLQYKTGQGLSSLPIYRSNKALGSQTTQTAPERTAADVVYKPVAKAANGGRIGYADGVGPIPLGLVDYKGTEWENSMPKLGGTLSQVSQPIERKMGLISNPDGSYPGENMPNPIQALPRPGQYSTQIQSQQPQVLTQAMGLLQNPKMANTLPNIQDVMQKAKRDPQLMATIRKVLPMIQSRRGMSPVSRTNAAKGGLMNVMNHEMDLRAKGGFVPIGKKERADDVPARLSLNEFVMTAKAVRNAGKGSVNKGAKKMYSLMKHLEKGGNL